MTFANPDAFFLFIILVPFIILVIYNYPGKLKAINRLISDKAFRTLARRAGREMDFFKSALTILALACFITALAGPQWGDIYQKVDTKGIEITFLLDTSESMNAEDLKPSRLEVSKQLINAITSELSSDYISLINFAGISYVQCPLTSDYEAFRLMVDATDISPSSEQGTDISMALNLALKSFRKKNNNSRIIVLITDGEDQERAWKNSTGTLKKMGVHIFTIGVGVPEGAPIPVKNKDGKVIEWKRDKNNQMVKTRLDEKTLMKIAAETNGKYFRLTNSSSIEKFTEIIKDYNREILSKKVKKKKKQQFFWPLLFGIILLIIEMFLTERKIRWKKEN